MSELTPVVSPSINATGTSIGVDVTALFGRALEAGSITPTSCFLVEIKSDSQLENSVAASNMVKDIVPAKTSIKRIDLLTTAEVSTIDYGDTLSAGMLYRSKVVINPDQLLKPNTNYAVLLSKDISTITVFDPKVNVNNDGTGTIAAIGTYTGLISNTYTVLINKSGDKTSAEFSWIRLSDNYTSVAIKCSSKYLEIEKGLKIKFLDGNFVVGDSFTVKVIPADFQASVYGWNFSTGSGEIKTPEDNHSDDLINLPVINETGMNVPIDPLKIVSIEPANAATCLLIPRKSDVGIGDLIILTKEYTSIYNGYSMQFVGGGTAGSETIALTGKVFTITIEDGVTTAQHIIDAIAASAYNTTLVGTSSAPNTQQTIQPAKKFSQGQDNKPIKITFNKNIKDEGILDRIKIKTQAVFPATNPLELKYSYSISGKTITITLQELDV